MSESTRGKLSQTGLRAGRVSHGLGAQAGEAALADATPTLSRIQKGGVGTHV